MLYIFMCYTVETEVNKQHTQQIMYFISFKRLKKHLSSKLANEFVFYSSLSENKEKKTE